MKSIIFATFIILLTNSSVIAQSSNSDWNMMMVREDKVVPSLVGNYEAALADLKDYLIEINEKDIQYFCHMQDDYSFTHVIPVDSYDAIDDLNLQNWVKQKNDPELNLIYNELSNAIESSKYYMTNYCGKLSYVPDSENWIEGLPYRKWNYYYFYPGSEDAVKEILGLWQDLYVKNDVPYGFRVFEGAIGTEQPMFIFTNWAADPKDHMEKLYLNMEFLGEEGAILWNLTMDYVRKVETVEGWYLPQYSYTQNQKFAE